MIQKLTLAAAVFAAASVAHADIMLKTSPMSVTLAPGRQWTIVNMTWNSYPMMSNLGSNNGTVIFVGGVFSGSGHGYEELISKSLLVDGVPTTITDGSTYTGDTIQFTRTTTLNDAFRLTSTLTVTDKGTDERVVLQGIDAAKIVKGSAAYGFLGTRANTLTQYAAFDSQGELLSSGATDLEDGGQPRLQPAVAVAQYDPAAQKGVVSQITEGTDLGLDPFIWDRTSDNKLYFGFAAMGGTAAPNKHYTIRQIVTPFEAAPDSWMSAAGDIVVPEPTSAAFLFSLIPAIAFYCLHHRRCN